MRIDNFAPETGHMLPPNLGDKQGTFMSLSRNFFVVVTVFANWLRNA